VLLTESVARQGQVLELFSPLTHVIRALVATELIANRNKNIPRSGGFFENSEVLKRNVVLRVGTAALPAF
jgi:hypothetical protein